MLKIERVNKKSCLYIEYIIKILACQMLVSASGVNGGKTFVYTHACMNDWSIYACMND